MAEVLVAEDNRGTRSRELGSRKTKLRETDMKDCEDGFGKRGTNSEEKNDGIQSEILIRLLLLSFFPDSMFVDILGRC